MACCSSSKFVYDLRIVIYDVYSLIFLFMQKTAYELRISDRSSDVCSSDLRVCTTPAALATIFRCSGKSFLVIKQHVPRRQRACKERLRCYFCYDTVQQIGRASCRERVRQYV